MAKRYYKQKKYFSLQNETKQYIKRLATFNTKLTGADIADLDNFIAGLKQLNLWQNIICWPMRSIHNIGTGSTVLSLGGGGTYNGTMLNSPTWGTIGMTFPRTTASCVSITRPIGSNPEAEYSIFSVHCNFVQDNLYRALWIGRDASNDRMFSRTAGGGADAYQAGTVGVSAPTSINGNHSTALVASSGSVSKTVTAYKDGTVSSSTTGTNTGNNTIYNIGGLSTDSSRSFGYEISFNAAFTKALNANEVILLHNLIKTTIGRDLGLP
jgi:hypothetical protein